MSTFDDQFTKLAQRMERDARRRGGPLDTTFIGVPCKSCGKHIELPIRRFVGKRPARCPHCKGHLDEEVARQLIIRSAVAAAERLRDTIREQRI